MHLKQNHLEIGSSLGTVFILILVILWISANLDAPAIGYVAALMAFVVAMGAAGIWIAKMYGK